MHKLTRLLTVAAVGTMTALTTMPAISRAQDERPLVIVTDSLGREVFSPLIGNAPELHFLTAINELLVYRGRGADSDLYPGLAERWEVSEDGRTYTFHLRDVTFSDGTPFTAEDVAFTFELLASDESRNPRKFIVEWIESTEVVDPHTIRVTLERPQPSFLVQLANFAPYLPMLSKAHFEKLGVDEANRNPLGTGPYRLAEHRLSELVRLEAVEGHWRETPDFTSVEVRIAPDEQSRIAMLMAGEADLIPISGAKAREVEDAGYRILESPGAYYLLVALGGQVLPERAGYDETSPWASRENAERSRKVRRALCLAIDTDEIIERVLYGTATPFGLQQFDPNGPFFREEWQPYGHDPAEAQRLLVEAGYPGGFDRPITMLLNPDMSPEAAELGEVVAMYWEQLGLTVQRRMVDTPVFRREWYSRGPIQKMGSYILASTPLYDPLDWYALTADPDGTINQLYEDEELSELVAEALAETDAERQSALRTELGNRIYDGHVACPIAFQSSLYAASDRVGSWERNSSNKYLHNIEHVQASGE